MAEEWTTCTMCRALTTGQDVLERAKDRAVEWPKPLSQPPNNEPQTPLSVNEAFDSLASLLNNSTRYCKRVHHVCNPNSKLEEQHCARFHGNPRESDHVSQKKGVAVNLPAGSYCVSNSQTQHTQVVNIEPGQSINLAFTQST